MSEPRIVSLISSATEILCALGFEENLVGRSHECDFPPSLGRLPVLTEPKFRTDGTSYDIDQRVKAILEQGLSVYRVDADALARLRPDVIVTQSQCDVCAVSQRDVDEAVARLVDSRPRVISLEPNDLGDVRDDIRTVANALDAGLRGEELVARLRARMDAIALQAGAGTDRPTVACIEWIDPLMSAGNWMPELVHKAGGRNLFGEAGRHSPWMQWEDLLQADPEVLLLLPCGFDLERTRKEARTLEGRPGWNRLRAVREGRVYVCDGNQYFNRPGPRLVESLEILAEILHPGVFSFGHEGTGWERVESTREGVDPR